MFGSLMRLGAQDIWEWDRNLDRELRRQIIANNAKDLLLVGEQRLSENPEDAGRYADIIMGLAEELLEPLKGEIREKAIALSMKSRMALPPNVSGSIMPGVSGSFSDLFGSACMKERSMSDLMPLGWWPFSRPDPVQKLIKSARQMSRFRPRVAERDPNPEALIDKWAAEGLLMEGGRQLSKGNWEEAEKYADAAAAIAEEHPWPAVREHLKEKSIILSLRSRRAQRNVPSLLGAHPWEGFVDTRPPFDRAQEALEKAIQETEDAFHKAYAKINLSYKMAERLKEAGDPRAQAILNIAHKFREMASRATGRLATLREFQKKSIKVFPPSLDPFTHMF